MTKSKSNVQFADVYLGCQVVANIMGLNVETVRKRAKAGKIPAKQNERGTWTFSHHELVCAGIEPFRAHGCSIGLHHHSANPPVAAARRNVTDVFFVLDRSGSMLGLENGVIKSLQDQLDVLRRAAGPNDVYNVSIINFSSTVDVTLRPTPVGEVPPAGRLYLHVGGTTALYDAIAEAISLSRLGDDSYHAMLISVITDGHENSSQKITRDTLSQTITSLTATGRYTFALAGPQSCQTTALAIGIPKGNVTEWDGTAAGLDRLTTSTVCSLNTYTESRGRGQMLSSTFYAQPVVADPASFAKKLEGSLSDVTDKIEVQRVSPGDPLKIREFAERKFGAFDKGSVFYQLSKSEDVQDYKGIIVQDTTKGQFFSGWESAKRLLGLPEFKGTVRVRPGSLGEFKVFVQSTSVNRRLVPGTAVVRVGG